MQTPTNELTDRRRQIEEQVLTNLMLYLVSNTVGTSVWMY
jgi:hypothetical protein